MKTNNFQIATKLLLITILSTTLFLSCKKNEDEVIVYGDAKFKVVNAVQGSSAQDFYQGDTKVTTTAVAYGEVSDYLTVKAGTSTISFKTAGTQTVNASNTVGANTDINYTLFYVNNLNGSGEIIGFADSNAQPASGKAHVRFLNLGGVLTNAINISVNSGQELLTGLAFGKISNYGAIDANVDLKFSLVGSVSSTVIPGSSFQSGKTYTVWFDAANTTTAQYHIVAQN
ncbi:DUF4397 domain-containing protein [Pedobacter insulae]|uniref:DUF4397 domain-containing protein n=1 Tax=Pedobacter insulae TaxID=414048 RepID=A0A1I2UHE2_9SPHI|nr:DUF4397 domain-containing protein [Pedobacter insulae]SFG76480.1 protein of unknown function [Pedobacter insulae]